MNERIKQLWEESTGAAVPEDGFYSSASSYNIEKFAELIIQECVNVAMRSVGDDEPKEAWYLIQEHFGVEE